MSMHQKRMKYQVKENSVQVFTQKCDVGFVAWIHVSEYLDLPTGNWNFSY